MSEPNDTTTQHGPACRFCGTPTRESFADLGSSPPCESFVAAEDILAPEVFYPLHAWVCHECFLVQLDEFVSPEEIFTEYAYFSSYSSAWLEHARVYAEQQIERWGLGPASQVIELASNDGYLLINFVEAGIPALGVEPAANVARVAEDRQVPTRVEFFGEEYAKVLRSEGLRCDLLAANNVLAQVPDLNSFVAGIGIVLKDEGVATIEFPHLLKTMEENQFDQIYHEHFSYFSLYTVEKIFARHGMKVFDVEELWTHGGSIRVYAALAGSAHAETERLQDVRAKERAFGIDDIATYRDFAEQARETKRALVSFLIEAKRAGKRIVGYGAPGKGNTMLNYCGIRTDFLDFTVDRNPYKHGRYTPGTRIPIHAPEKLDEARPDYILILPWNLRDEIVEQLAHAREWGAKFVVAVPTLQVID
jgi:hypothetical protein